MDFGGKDTKETLWFIGDFSGCGYIRSIFPNEYLNNLHGNKGAYRGLVSSRFIVDRNILQKTNFIHFQRQVTKEQLQFMYLFRKIRDENPKEFNFQLVYDLDDLFTEVPSYNYGSKYFKNEFILEHLKLIVNIVDIFTVSTFPLKKAIESLNGKCKVQIIPNYVPKYIYHPYDFVKKQNAKPRVLWAGSPTHFNDFDMGDFGLIHDLIINTADEFEWVIAGIKTLPPWLSLVTNKIKLVPWCSLFLLPTVLKEINADFGIAPLLNNHFNICKSNIKILDYASADILSICSNLKPYEDSKVFLKDNWKDDRDQIIDLFLNKEKYNDLLNKQRRYLNKYWIEDNIKDYEELYGIKRK